MALRFLVLLSVAILVVSSNKYTETYSEQDEEETETIASDDTCKKDDGCTEQSQNKIPDKVETDLQQEGKKDLEMDEEKESKTTKETTETNEDESESRMDAEHQRVKQSDEQEEEEEENTDVPTFEDQKSDEDSIEKFEEDRRAEQERRRLNLDELRLVRLDGVEVGHVKYLQLKPGGPTYRMITRAMKPLLFEIPNFLSKEECDHLIQLAVKSGLSTSIAGFDPKVFDGDLRDVLKAKKEEDLKTGKPLSTLNKSYHTQVFTWWDIDGDGKISLNEMKQTLRRFYLVYLTQEEIQEMFQVIGSDAYDDFDITKEELEEKIDLGQIHVYMDYLRLKHPKHRSRYSDQAWLPQNKRADPILRELHERVINITKLPRIIVQGGEALQVVRYGVHGHYHAHYDSSPNKGDSSPCCHQVGDNVKCNLCRFITILYYLNDVEEGGETAFLTANNETHNEELMGREDYYNLGLNCYKAKLVIPPKRGKAVMWYNHFLDESGFLGEMDKRSGHGGCTIWKGVKWIANNWINGPPLAQAHIKSVYEEYGWD